MDNNNNMDFYTPENNGSANGAPAGNFPAGQPQNNGMATAAMIVGIVTCVLGWCCCPYLSFPAGIAGIVLAILSKKGQRFSGKALAGLICSIAGIAGGVLSIVASVLLQPILEEFIEQINNMVGSSGT